MNIQTPYVLKSSYTDRYLVDRHGTDIRPHRVFDTHKRQTIIVTADHAIAAAMAEEFNEQWRRSQRWPRFVEAVKRLFGRQRATEPAKPLSVREPSLSARTAGSNSNVCQSARRRKRVFFGR